MYLQNAPSGICHWVLDMPAGLYFVLLATRVAEGTAEGAGG